MAIFDLEGIVLIGMIITLILVAAAVILELIPCCPTDLISDIDATRIIHREAAQ